MKISSIILLGFMFILLLFGLTTFINLRQADKVDENAAYLDKSTEIIRHSNRFQRNLLNMVSGLRGYLLTGEPYFSVAYDSSARENQQILRDLFVLIPNTSKQYLKLDTINQLNNKWIQDFSNPLVISKKEASQSSEQHRDFVKLYAEKSAGNIEKELLLDLQARWRIFTNDEYEQRDLMQDMVESSATRTRNLSYFLIFFSVIAGLGIAIWLAGTLSGRILQMVNLSNSIAAGVYKQPPSPIMRNDELSKLEQSLKRMSQILEENFTLLKSRNEELDQFAHIVSHDLKSPLRGIGNVVSWIEEDHEKELSPRVKEYLEMIKGRIARGENLVNGLLNYARAGKQIHLKEMINTRDLVEEIVQSVEIKPNFDIEISETLPLIYSEKIPLIVIFSNLISNAMKYNNSPDGVVKIYSKETQGSLEFFVEDNGIGIDQKHQEKIFLIFQTLHTRESFDSTGVGLAIVKKILDNRNERITVNSSKGKGSVFSFTWKKQ